VSGLLKRNIILTITLIYCLKPAMMKPMRFYRSICFLALIFLLVPGNHFSVSAAEEKAGKKVLDDAELKTEGAATRKPLPSVKTDAEKKESGKTPHFLEEGKRGVSFDLDFHRLNGEIIREVSATKKILAESPFSRFPRTRFEFPIDILVCSVKNRILFSGNWGIEAAFSKSVMMTGGDERTESSWWGRIASEKANELWANPDSLDYITESEVDMDLIDLGGGIIYRVVKKSDFLLTTGLGYFQQHITYDTKDFWGRFYLASNYPTHYQFDYIVSLTGPSEKYEFVYHVPYLEVEADYFYKDWLRLSANLGFSPFTKVENEFTFYHTMVLEQGDGTGNMLMLSVDTAVFFHDDICLKIDMGYRKADLDGDKTQYSGGVWLGETDQKMDMEQFLIGMGIQYSY